MKAAGAWIVDPCRPHTGGNLCALGFSSAGSSPLRAWVSLGLPTERRVSALWPRVRIP